MRTTRPTWRRIFTSCCNETQRAGRPQTTEKNFIVKNLRLLFKDTLKRINHYGSLNYSWIHKASNEQYWYWSQLIKQLTHPKTPLPERPEEWGPLPSWQAQHANTTHKVKSDNSNDKDEHGNNEDNAESWKWRTATTSTTTTQKPTTATSHLLPPNLPNEYRYRTQNYGSTILKCVKW